MSRCPKCKSADTTHHKDNPDGTESWWCPKCEDFYVVCPYCGGGDKTCPRCGEPGAWKCEDESRVIDIDFFVKETLPSNLMKDLLLSRKNFPDEVESYSGIIAVRTYEDKSHIFEFIGSNPDELNRYMHKLAAEDGIDLNKAFAE